MSRQPDQRLSFLNDQYGYYPNGQSNNTPSQGQPAGGYSNQHQQQQYGYQQPAQQQYNYQQNAHGAQHNAAHNTQPAAQNAQYGYGYANSQHLAQPAGHAQQHAQHAQQHQHAQHMPQSQYYSQNQHSPHAPHAQHAQHQQHSQNQVNQQRYAMPPLPPVLQQEERVVAALQNMFPEFPQTTLRTAARARQSFEQAAQWLAEMKRQGMVQGGVIKQPIRPAMSIRDKFRQPQQQLHTQQHHAHYAQQYGHPQAQAQHYAQQYAPQMQPQMAYQPKKKLVKKFDEDDFSASDDSDSEVEYDATGQRQFEERVLNFLNAAPKSAILDVSGCTEEMVDILIKKRPFQTLAQAAKVDVPSNVQPGAVRRRGALKKSAGSKIVDASLSTLRGYEAVDSLIQECAGLGKNVKDGISAWGIDITGSSEIDFTEIEANPTSTFFTEKPALLSDTFDLKNYQQVGINWLSLLYDKKLSCILADEMGLGKTCQVISFLAHLREKGERGPHLVVCPSSTLENWLRELNRFCPSLVIEPYYGNQTERTEMRENIIDNGVHFDVMVTTYNLATGGKQDLGFLKSLKFNVCVYDEGHLLKNSQSERYNKLMKLKANFRVLLTGTPLQNNLRELVSLLSFILPNLFEQNKDDLLEVFKFKAKTQSQESNERSQLLSEQRIVKAKTMMAPFVLRRRKAQVLQHLPAKSHEVVFCEMLPHQRDMYLKEFNRNRGNLRVANNEVKADNASGKSKTRKGRQATIALDNVLMKLRQMALHPLLFRSLYTDEKLQQMSADIMHEDKFKDSNRAYIFEDMQVMNDFELNRLCLTYPTSIGQHALDSQQFMASGKVQQLTDMIVPMKAAGDRILIFSQFTKMLDVLEKVLDKIGFKYLRLDGQTPVEVRQDMIDKYYEDDSITVFLLSTKAGGFGINLACANVVIIFDLSFNPHDDKQAEDRAHRVGQTRPVKVIRMITKGTIEENIMELANTKLALDRHVSEENENDVDGESEAFVADMVLDTKGAEGEDINELPEPTPEPTALESYGGPTHGIFSPAPSAIPKAAAPKPRPRPAMTESPSFNSFAPYMSSASTPRGTPPPRPQRKVGRPPTRQKAQFDSDLSDDDGDASEDFSDLEEPVAQPIRRSSRRAAAAAAQRASEDFKIESEDEIEKPPSFVVVLKYGKVEPKQEDGLSLNGVGPLEEGELLSASDEKLDPSEESSGQGAHEPETHAEPEAPLEPAALAPEPVEQLEPEPLEPLDPLEHDGAALDGDALAQPEAQPEPVAAAAPGAPEAAESAPGDVGYMGYNYQQYPYATEQPDQQTEPLYEQLEPMGSFDFEPSH